MGSHRWGAPGYMKYTVLLMHFIGGPAVCFGISTAIVTFLLRVYVIDLPTFPARDEGFLGTSEISLWEFAAGVLGTSIGLAFGHVFCRCSPGFLDVACIHQTDAVKKTAAIKALPGFILASQKLFVMWEPMYFTRGWCCFELAVFKALKTDGQLALFPLELYMLMTVMALATMVGACFTLLIWLLLPGFLAWLIGMGVNVAIGTTVAASAAQKVKNDRRTLVEQLETFSIETSQIAVESDRVLILEEVGRLFEGGIDAFNNTVREEVRKEVVDTFFAQRAMISYQLACIPFFPTILMFVSFACSFRQNPWEFHFIIALHAICTQFVIGPCLIAMAMSLGKRWNADSALNDHMEWWGPVVSINRYHVSISLMFWVLGVAGSAGWLFPAMIASGNAFFGLRPWHAIFIEVAFSACYSSRIPYVFGRRKLERSRTTNDESIASTVESITRTSSGTQRAF